MKIYTIRNPKTGETITREFTTAQLREAVRDGYTVTSQPAAPQITETRTMSATKLRSVCIQHDWYTCGTNKEYGKLFDRLYDSDGIPAHLTTEKLAEIAQDIMDHSRITDYTITSVMFELARSCTVYFDIAE